MITEGVDEAVGAKNPVAQGGAVSVSGLLEDMEAWGIGCRDVGIDLVERGVVLAEGGEGLHHGGAKTFVAILVGYDDADGGTAVDGVVVVEFDATYRMVGVIEGIEG